MRRWILILICLFMVPNVFAIQTQLNITISNTLIGSCNFSNYSIQGYQYTLFEDGINISSGFGNTRGNTKAILTDNYLYADETLTWDVAHPPAYFVDNDTTTHATRPIGAAAIMNITYKVPFISLLLDAYWNGSYNNVTMSYIHHNLSNWSTGELIYMRAYSYGNRLIIRPLNLTSRKYDELGGDSGVHPYDGAAIEENITYIYNISTYNKGVLINIQNFTATPLKEYKLSCRAIDLQSYNGSHTSWVNASVTENYRNLSLTFKNEISKTLITDNVSFSILDTNTGAFLSNWTITGTFKVKVNITGHIYVISYTSEDYYSREYYYTTSFINSNLTLYLLNFTGDRIIHTVYDEFGTEAINITIHQLRQYGASYLTVAMARTNFEGAAVLSAELYNVNYRMIYYKPDGTLIRITTPSPFLNTESQDQVIITNDVYDSWRRIDNVYNNVTIYNNSGVITARMIYTDPTGLVRDGCLTVKRLTTQGVDLVCNNCTHSPSAVITCVIDHTVEGEYQAYGMIDTNTTGSWYMMGFVTWKVSHPFRFGQEGVFLTFLLVGTMGVLGVSTITGSILLMVLGLSIPLVLSLVAGFTFGLYAWIIVLAFVILFLVRKVNK